MSEREAFGPNLRRVRVQRGISLDSIAEATKISPELLVGLESNDFSRWPSDLYARAYIRAYAMEIGVDADATVNDFCRWFPQGDRRAERIVREQAAIVGHTLNWKDDLVGGVVQKDRRARPPASDDDEDVPALAHWKLGRIVAVLSDAAAVVVVASAAAEWLPIGKSAAVAACAMIYHGVTLAALGSTPAVWAIHTYLNHRHPTARRANQRFLRILRTSDRVKV